MNFSSYFKEAPLDKGILAIFLHHQDALNASNTKHQEELSKTLKGTTTNDAIREVVIIGSSKAFSTVADVRKMPPPDMVEVLNDPTGPLVWADEVGVTHIFSILSNLQQCCVEYRYRASPFLRRKLYSGEKFHA